MTAPNSPIPGSLFDTILQAHNGDRVAAAVEVARDLMRDEPAVFKAGYSLGSALLSVTELYQLNDQQQAAVKEQLEGNQSEGQG